VTYKDSIEEIRSILQQGIKLAKCRRCGCMKMTLEKLRYSLSSHKKDIFLPLITDIENFLQQVESVKYDCLGCEYCFPAVAMNKFNEAFPEIISSQFLSCSFKLKGKTWSL
jgi:tetrahydromethanopterin S-methyltransferase subunit A